MDINDQKTITLGGSPKVGAEFFSLGFTTGEGPPTAPEPGIQMELRGIAFQLEAIDAHIIAIYHHLTRPRWYHKAWAWLKGVFHVA